MYKQKINLVCNGGYWHIELPFNAGNIELGDSIQEAMDMSDDLKIINYVENGLDAGQIEGEGDVALPKEEIEIKIHNLKLQEAKE